MRIITWKVGRFTRSGEIMSEDDEKFMVKHFDAYDGDLLEPVMKAWSHSIRFERDPIRVSSRGGVRPGAGRPAVADPLKQCPWGIPTSQLNQLKGVAEGLKQNPAALFRSIISDYLKNV